MADVRRLYTIRHDYTALRTSGTRELSRIRLIVLHSAEALSAEAVGRWFADPRAQGSAHFGVDQDSIQRYLPLRAVPWGAPGVNSDGVHIEQCGYARWTRDGWLRRDEMLDRVAWLMAVLARRLDIPLRSLSDEELRRGERGVTTHRQCTLVYGGTHTDPGAGYPLDWVLARARHYRRLMGG